MTLLLWVAGAVTAVCLVLTASNQIYDTNFYSLWEATALLAGDHPYRDFFEWGIPLQAVVSLCAQLAVGNRLIGEFAVQWIGIVAGTVIAFHLGLRASGSVAACAVMLAIAVPLVAAAPTYHYPKLLLYPLATWLIWRYMDAPGMTRAALVGAITAAAFLFRHDHGVHVAAAAALGFALARIAVPSSRNLRLAAAESGAAGATALALLAPWLILVHTSEGLPAYVESRLQRYAQGSPYSNPYASLLSMNPVRVLTPGAAPADGAMWLQQAALLVPLLLLAGAALALLGSRARRETAPAGTAHLVVAAALLGLVDWRLFREPGYVAAVAPFTAALAARLIVTPPGIPRLWWMAHRAVVALLLSATAAATLVYARSSGVRAPWRLAASVPDAFGQLLASPPIDGFAPAEEVRSFDRSTWNAQEVHMVQVLMRYVRDCSAAGDRVLVTGQTPFQVGYYVERPIAGGHLFWHEGFRSDPVRERESLALLQRQSVPFAYSTHDPVLDDLKRYPRIHDHVSTHYAEIEGSRGRVLVDTRRQPTGAFSTLGFPCFR